MVDSWKEVTAKWQQDDAFLGYNSEGATVRIGNLDGKPGIGPMEMLLLGVAGCTGIDVVSTLGKKRQNLQNLQIFVRGKRAEQHPRVYTDIEIMYYLWGDSLDPRAVEHAIQLSKEKYCSASIMMGAVANISTSYKILAPGEQSDVLEPINRRTA